MFQKTYFTICINNFSCCKKFTADRTFYNVYHNDTICIVMTQYSFFDKQITLFLDTILRVLNNIFIHTFIANGNLNL